MTPALTRLRSSKRVSWTTILGLLLVPLTVAGVLLWGLWNPSDRLDTVTAAVVNEDAPVELNGQTVPLGRVLAGELIGGDSDTNYTWVLTDAEDAKAGLKDGNYATVITIPENFSAAATSLSGDPDEARAAHIDIAESDRGRLIDTALSGIVTQTATNVLNQQLGEQFVGNVYVGMNKLGDGIGQAADGATQLAAGGRQLAGGASQLADGTSQLATGTQQLAGGAGELSSGASQLSTGVGQYVAGASSLAQAYAPLGQGAAAAATQLKTTIGALGQLQVDSAAPQGQVEQGLTAVGTAMSPQNPDGLPAAIGSLVADCSASGADPAFCERLQTVLTQQSGAIGEGLTDVQAGMQGLAAAQSTFQASLQSGQDGSAGGDPAAQLDQLIGGLGQFGAGLDQLAAQGGQLASGASELSSGASQLSTGVGQLAGSTPALAEGASQLASGTTQSADGAASLASGLDEAAAGVPTTTEAQRDKLAETAVRPVEARGGSDELFNASGVPLFAGVALWAGALAAFMLLAPLWSRTREAARGVFAITLRSALPALSLGAVQGAIAGVVLPLALHYDFARGVAFFGLAVLAGVAFALVVQGLSALLGGLGRFIAFALLVVAFAVGIVSTVPGPLAAIGDASPIGSAFTGFQSVAMEASGAGGAAILLALWGLGGLALTALAVARARRAG